MPGFDGTGPMGAGPMTGRGMGPCGGGYGRGRGGGRRWHPFWRRPAEVSDKDKAEYLQDEAKSLREELKEVEDELGKLKK